MNSTAHRQLVKIRWTAGLAKDRKWKGSSSLSDICGGEGELLHSRVDPLDAHRDRWNNFEFCWGGNASWYPYIDTRSNGIMTTLKNYCRRGIESGTIIVKVIEMVNVYTEVNLWTTRLLHHFCFVIVCRYLMFVLQSSPSSICNLQRKSRTKDTKLHLSAYTNRNGENETDGTNQNDIHPDVHHHIYVSTHCEIS